MAKFIASQFLLKSNYPNFDFSKNQEVSDIFIDFVPFMVKDEKTTLANICRFVCSGMNLKNKRFEMAIWGCVLAHSLKSKKDELDFDDILETANKAFDFLNLNKKNLSFIFDDETHKLLEMTLMNLDRLGEIFINEYTLTNN